MDWPGPLSAGQHKAGDDDLGDDELAKAAALAASSPDPIYDMSPATSSIPNRHLHHRYAPSPSTPASPPNPLRRQPAPRKQQQSPQQQQQQQNTVKGNFAGINLFTQILKRNTSPSLHSHIESAVQAFIRRYQQLALKSNQNELVHARSQYSRELLANFQNICGEESIKQAVTEFKAYNDKHPPVRGPKPEPARPSPPLTPNNAPRGPPVNVASPYRTDTERQRQVAGQYARLIKAWNHACTCTVANCGNDICAKIKPSVMHQQSLKAKGLAGQCGPNCNDCSLYRRLCSFSSAQRTHSERAQQNVNPHHNQMQRQHSAGSHMYQLQQAEQQAVMYDQTYPDQSVPLHGNPHGAPYQNNHSPPPVKNEPLPYSYATKPEAPPADPDMMDVAKLLDDEVETKPAPAANVKKEKRTTALTKRKSSGRGGGQATRAPTKEKVRKTKASATPKTETATSGDFADLFNDDSSDMLGNGAVNSGAMSYTNGDSSLDGGFDMDPTLTTKYSNPMSGLAATPDDFAQINF